MASQFPALDLTADTDKPVDTDLSGATDDFGMYVVRLIQADTADGSQDSVSHSHFVSLEAGSLLGLGTHDSHSANDGLSGLVSLPSTGTQDSPAHSFDGSNVGMAGLVQAALDSSLIFLDSDGYAKGGPGGGGGGTGGGFTPATYVSGGGSGNYNIEIVFKGTSWTQPLYDDFKKAADLLSSYISGDLPNVLYKGKIIDDLSITAELTAIDGVNGILGQSGPTAIRTGSYLPAAGSMQFDIADAQSFETQHLFDDIVLHEMMHTLGFGTIWSYKGLLSGAGTDAPLFTGALASGVYGGAVPVEQDGGSGTRDSHWDEQTFKGELMTGYIGYTDSNGAWVPSDTLSAMSVASLGDLGYTLNSATTGSHFAGSPDWIV